MKKTDNLRSVSGKILILGISFRDFLKKAIEFTTLQLIFLDFWARFGQSSSRSSPFGYRHYPPPPGMSDSFQKIDHLMVSEYKKPLIRGYLITVFGKYVSFLMNLLYTTYPNEWNNSVKFLTVTSPQATGFLRHEMLRINRPSRSADKTVAKPLSGR